MIFQSILFNQAEYRPKTSPVEPPEFLGDLNLDQVINAVTSGKQEYDLKPFYYTALHAESSIRYRHAILQDLEDPAFLTGIQSFSEKMVVARRYLGLVKKLDFKYHREGWFVEAALAYCNAVSGLVEDLNRAGLKSEGFLAFREFMNDYTDSEGYRALWSEAEQLKAGLASIRYCVLIKNFSVQVRKYEGETDYSREVEKTFEKFKQREVKDYRIKPYHQAGMNHIEAQVLGNVAKLYPEIFARLDQFYERQSSFYHETIRVFDREIQFYLAYLEYIEKVKKAGLKFCYPEVSDRDKEVYDEEGFDLALAQKRISENQPIVCNDFYLKDPERIFVVSGPNQGGKTTFARAFGQLHYLASLGLTVPGSKAKLFLYDRLFTHFEKEENLQNLRGKLQDDVIRIYEILDAATLNSIIIMNEIFTSTTVEDAVFLSKKILDRIIQLDTLSVCVTFLDELASLSEKTVSMVSTVDPHNPALRTFKIVRKPADGLAYAISIAEKYRLTYHNVKERLQA